MSRAILSFVDRDMSDVVDRLSTCTWSCAVSRSSVATTDWRAIASRFEVSPQLLAAHTKHADRVTVRVTPII